MTQLFHQHKSAPNPRFRCFLSFSFASNCSEQNAVIYSIFFAIYCVRARVRVTRFWSQSFQSATCQALFRTTLQRGSATSALCPKNSRRTSSIWLQHTRRTITAPNCAAMDWTWKIYMLSLCNISLIQRQRKTCYHNTKTSGHGTAAVVVSALSCVPSKRLRCWFREIASSVSESETDALRTDFKTEVDTPNESTRVASIRPKIRWCYFVLNTHLFFFSVRMSFFVVVKTNS